MANDKKRPIPLHLICGFLGSGKTTLLRRILAQQPQDESLAVLVNEFGKVGVDGELLDGFESTVRELRAGCICCELRIDFLRTLQDVLENFKPQRLVVEATGVADPGEMIKALGEASLEGRVELASVVTVVDADMFGMREVFGPFYENQIKAGDLVLLNKTDLVESGQVEGITAELVRLNPGGVTLPVVQCAVERSLILSPQGHGLRPQGAGLMDLTEITSLALGPDHRPGGGDEFVSFSFESEALLSRACLEEFLAGLPWELFRVKGFVRTERGPEILNYTYRRPTWEAGEFDGPSRLAFVGWRLEPETILAPLHKCRD
jgi:G3E family GTPase